MVSTIRAPWITMETTDNNGFPAVRQQENGPRRTPVCIPFPYNHFQSVLPRVANHVPPVQKPTLPSADETSGAATGK